MPANKTERFRHEQGSVMNFLIGVCETRTVKQVKEKMLTNGLKISFPLRAKVENTVHEVEINRPSGKEEVPEANVNLLTQEK